MKRNRFSTIFALATLLSAVSGKAEEAPGSNSCKELITAANDSIIAVYRNGEPVSDSKRTLMVDRPGLTLEKMSIAIEPGDWIVFHLVHHPLRKVAPALMVAGCLDHNEFGFVSNASTRQWFTCEDQAQVPGFIKERGVGVDDKSAAKANAVQWTEGMTEMKVAAGQSFAGQAIWGTGASTWIKFVALPNGGEGVAAKKPSKIAKGTTDPETLPPAQVKHWPVQIISAIYGTGGKNADVTAKVKQIVEQQRKVFAVNPRDIGADPNPYWNKGLRIVFMKDGVRREQHRNENEWVLPESFYGPQDATELRTWLTESRWVGEDDEIQFHSDRTFTVPGFKGSTPQWEATSKSAITLIWSSERKTVCEFDFTWSSFHAVDNVKDVHHAAK